MADINQVRSGIRDSGNRSRNEVEREDIEAAIAKSAELRALHAALMQGNGPVKLRFDLASPVSCNASQFSAQDYPVFTPSYEDESLPGYQRHVLENRNYAEIWGDDSSDRENVDEIVSTDYGLHNPFSRKGFPSRLVSFDGLGEDRNSVVCSCANNITTVLGASPGPDSCKSRRRSIGDLTLIPASSCNKCKPAVISSESDGVTKNSKKSNMIVPYAGSRSSLNSQPSSKGVKFSCLFPRIKKKNKDECSPVSPSFIEEVFQTCTDSEIVSIETLKKELIEAIESRNAALVEVAEMKSVIGELGHKLEYLETYCEELKKALQVKNPQTHPTKYEISVYGNGENPMPVGEEELVEGFSQFVSESRRAVKQFCKILVGQIQDTDLTLVNNLNSLLQPNKLSLNSKYSKPVLHHIEGAINQSLFQDFENSVFQRDGAPKILDPEQARHEKLNSFVALRSVSWNEVLHKGINYYSDEFSKFCDDKMGGILATLRWTKPWSEQLLQAFFAAAKSIWLLHLLAFSSDPPFRIMRVDENRPFQARYMEDIFAERQRLQDPVRVKIMVLPGFYVHDRVVRCKVLCKCKPLT